MTDSLDPNGGDADDYLLGDDENRRIFLDGIVPDQMADRAPQDTPVAVFLVGQPGAGKSRVGAALAARLNQRGGFVDVDTDLYKPYHPAYDDLMARDDRLMAAFTRADGRRWMAQAHQYVRQHRLNAVVHETAQNPEVTAETMSAYWAAGHRVEVVALGVPAAMSNQGIINRYHEQVRDRGRGRLTVQTNADQSYRGIVELARLVDQQHLAHQVGVFRRGEVQPRYGNALDDKGRWHRLPEFATAIEAERDRSWSAREILDFRRTQLKLRAEMGEEWQATLDRVDQQAAGHLRHPAPLDADTTSHDYTPVPPRDLSGGLDL